MTTFTVTYHYSHNYGAIFQAYALQHTIEKLGHTNTILEYARNKSKKNKLLSGSPMQMARNIYLRYLSVLRKKEMRKLDALFSDFHKNHLKLSKRYKSMEDLVQDPPDAQCLITGSDQVWNLDARKEFIPARFLDFGNESARRISYAASIERLIYTDEQKDMVRKYLSKFNAVSLREQSAKEYIESFAPVHAERVLDPVFLLTPDEWRKIAKEPRISAPYILCYQVQRNKRMQEVVDTLHRKTGYPVVSVCNSSIKWIRSDYTFFDVSPEEFIGFYDKASIVVSASFHGTALGIVFGKPTYGLVKRTHGNRIREILELFGLESFCIAENTGLPEPIIDSDCIRRTLESERNRSLAFLKSNIEDD